MKKLTFMKMTVAAWFAAVLMVGCATTGSPKQDYINAMTNATVMVDQVTLAADAAVKVGVLKGQDALNVLAVVKTARDGLNVARTMTNPTQAVSKIQITLAALAATQAYLSTVGVPK